MKRRIHGPNSTPLVSNWMPGRTGCVCRRWGSRTQPARRSATGSEGPGPAARSAAPAHSIRSWPEAGCRLRELQRVVGHRRIGGSRSGLGRRLGRLGRPGIARSAAGRRRLDELGRVAARERLGFVGTGARCFKRAVRSMSERRRLRRRRPAGRSSTCGCTNTKVRLVALLFDAWPAGLPGRRPWLRRPAPSKRRLREQQNQRDGQEVDDDRQQTPSRAVSALGTRSRSGCPSSKSKYISNLE